MNQSFKSQVFIDTVTITSLKLNAARMCLDDDDPDLVLESQVARRGTWLGDESVDLPEEVDTEFNELSEVNMEVV